MILTEWTLKCMFTRLPGSNRRFNGTWADRQCGGTYAFIGEYAGFRERGVFAPETEVEIGVDERIADELHESRRAKTVPSDDVVPDPRFLRHRLREPRRARGPDIHPQRRRHTRGSLAAAQLAQLLQPGMPAAQ